MPTLDELLQASAAMHVHLCPRQILGVRMGMLAAKELGLALPQSGKNKRLFTFMETDGCAADGVSVATGCWVGRRTMRIVDFGKVAATFVDTHTERAIRIAPHPDCRTTALRYAPPNLRRWHAMLAAYRTMPDDELLVVQPVALTVSLKAIISRPKVRTQCAHCGEEIINEREVWVDGECLCRACAGEAYYALEAPSFAARALTHTLAE